MSSFRFHDLTKVFPYTDAACPPDGECHDSTIAQVKMSMAQETDAAKKPKNFFQLVQPSLPVNATKADFGGLDSLVHKNETSSGDIYLEGTIKQLKYFMKNNLVVKPLCMFDSKIQVNFQVSYQYLGKYLQENTRKVSAQLAQIQNQTIR